MALMPGQEEVRPARQGGERRQPFVDLADRPLGDLEVQCAVLGSADRVVLVAEFVEGAVVDPDVLRELELTDQAGADDERGDAAVHPVVGRALGQCRTVGGAAANHPAPVHVVRGVARVEASRVRSQRAGIPERIHLLVVEVVVAHRVRAQLGIVLVRCQHQRRAAAPAAHELRGEQLLIVRRVGVLAADSRGTARRAPAAAGRPCSCHCGDSTSGCGRSGDPCSSG